MIAPDSPWFSREACEAKLAARKLLATRAERGKLAKRTSLRIGTWNLGWFPDGVAHGPSPEHARDVAWLACVITLLDVDVLAVQEVVTHARGRAALLDLQRALDAYTRGKHEALLDECPDDGRQHVGFLYDAARVHVERSAVLRELNPGRNACDMRLRPGLQADLRFGTGTGAALRAIVLHQDSGVLERDHSHRQASVAKLHELIGAAKRNVVVLGDWNTMGCERCATPSDGAAELVSLEAALPELTRIAPTHACSEYYRGRGVALDHVFVGRELRERDPDARVETHGVCGELQCAEVSGITRLSAFQHLSDHCPLVLTLHPRAFD